MAHCNLIKCCCVAVCPSHFWMALVMPLVNNVLLAMLSICTCRCFSTCPWLMTQKKQWYQVLPSNWFLHASLLTVNHIYLQRFGVLVVRALAYVSKNGGETTKMGSKKNPSCVNSHEIPMEIPEQKFTGLTVQLLMGHLKLRNSILQCSWARPI